MIGDEVPDSPTARDVRGSRRTGPDLVPRARRRPSGETAVVPLNSVSLFGVKCSSASIFPVAVLSEVTVAIDRDALTRIDPEASYDNDQMLSDAWG